MVIYSGYAKYYTGCRREIQCLCRFIYILWKNDVMHCPINSYIVSTE